MLCLAQTERLIYIPISYNDQTYTTKDDSNDHDDDNETDNTGNESTIDDNNTDENMGGKTASLKMNVDILTTAIIANAIWITVVTNTMSVINTARVLHL